MEKFNRRDSLVIGTRYNDNLRYRADWEDVPRRHTIQGGEQCEAVAHALAYMDQALAASTEHSETEPVFAGYAGRAKGFQHGKMKNSSEHAGNCSSEMHAGMAPRALHAGIVSSALHDGKATKPGRDEQEAKMEQERLERERQEKEEQEAARRKEEQEKKKKGKRKGLGGLSPEKKKMLKKLIMQKAAEDLRNEAKRKAEEKEAFINSRVEPLMVEGLAQGQLQTMVKNLHTRVAALEEEVYDWEVKIRKQDWEINELTLKVNDTKGKFIKPVLRKVNKTEGKLAKLEKKDTRDFRTTLKSTGQNKFGLDEKDEGEKPDWRGELKKGEEEAES